MIMQRDVEKTPCLRQGARYLAVFAAGRGIARRMVVSDDDRRRGSGQRRLVDLARMYDRGVQRSDGDNELAHELVARVEAQGHEPFALAVPELQREVAPHRTGGREQGPTVARLAAQPTR